MVRKVLLGFLFVSITLSILPYYTPVTLHSDNKVQYLSLSPAGNYVSFGEGTYYENKFVKEVSTSNTILETDGATQYIAFSPDDKIIIYTTYYDIFLFEIESNQTYQFEMTEKINSIPFVNSSHFKIVQDTNILTWDYRNLDSLQLVENITINYPEIDRFDFYYSNSWSPDGKFILSHELSKVGTTIIIIDTESGYTRAFKNYTAMESVYFQWYNNNQLVDKSDTGLDIFDLNMERKASVDFNIKDFDTRAELITTSNKILVALDNTGVNGISRTKLFEFSNDKLKEICEILAPISYGQIVYDEITNTIIYSSNIYETGKYGLYTINARIAKTTWIYSEIAGLVNTVLLLLIVFFNRENSKIVFGKEKNFTLVLRKLFSASQKRPMSIINSQFNVWKLQNVILFSVSLVYVIDLLDSFLSLLLYVNFSSPIYFIIASLLSYLDIVTIFSIIITLNIINQSSKFSLKELILERTTLLTVFWTISSIFWRRSSIWNLEVESFTLTKLSFSFSIITFTLLLFVVWSNLMRYFEVKGRNLRENARYVLRYYLPFITILNSVIVIFLFLSFDSIDRLSLIFGIKLSIIPVITFLMISYIQFQLFPNE